MSGEEGELPYETTPHAITGGLKRNAKGKPVGMANDPTGGFTRGCFFVPSSAAFTSTPLYCRHRSSKVSICQLMCQHV